MVAAVIVTLALAAFASGVQARTGREPLPAREIERAVVLPRGWAGHCDVLEPVRQLWVEAS